MKLSRAQSELNATYQEWRPFLLNPNYVRRDREVSWRGLPGRRHGPRLTQAEFADMVSHSEYSFQLFDGSIVQFYYKYGESNDVPVVASLGYYRNPAPLDPTPEDAAVDELAEAVMPDVDGGGEVAVPWLRLDYAPNHATSILHAAAHLHLSQWDGTRIPVSLLPAPRQWLEMIFAYFYPNEYQDHRLDAAGNYREDTPARVNGSCFELDPDERVSSLTHLVVPRA